MGGTMRSPCMAIIFAFELTHDANVFLPLLIGSVIAHCVDGADTEALDPDGESGATRDIILSANMRWTRWKFCLCTK